MTYKDTLEFELDKVMVVDYKIIHCKKTGYLRVYVKGQASFQDCWFCVGIIEDEAVLYEDYLYNFIQEVIFEILSHNYIKKPKIEKIKWDVERWLNKQIRNG